MCFSPARKGSGEAKPNEPRGWPLEWSVQPRAHPDRELGSLGWVLVDL